MGINPMQFISKFMSNNNNPMFNNLMNMAKNGDGQGIQNFARNICKERGIDFDTEFSKFMQGIKR